MWCKLRTARSPRRSPSAAWRRRGTTGRRDIAFHECLMPIRCADGSIVPATAVVPIAEQLGLVRLIDHRVIELVVAELLATPAVRVSVNVSPDSISDPDWWTA